MKVLHLMKTSVGGTWALRQMRELARLGVEVHVALPDRGPLWEAYRRHGIRAHELQNDFSLKKPWLLPGRSCALRRLVDSVRPDLIHSHFVGTTLTMRLALRTALQLPRIFQVPGPLHLEQALFRGTEIALAQPNDTWIATCSATRDHYLRAGVDPRRVFFSYYGTDTGLFARTKALGRLRREIGLPLRTPIVGMVAHMYPPKRIMGRTRGIKGHEDLIDAVAIAMEKVPDLKVVFVGGAWDGAIAYEKAIRRYAEQKIPGRAYFLGTRSDVPELYGDFDVAVHPSHSENLGGAAESLLMGVPTIATNVGGFPDLIIPEKTGCLVPPRQPEALARAIVRMLRNPERARAMAAAGKRRVLSTCDVATTAAQVLSIYIQVTARGGT